MDLHNVQDYLHHQTIPTIGNYAGMVVREINLHVKVMVANGMTQVTVTQTATAHHLM